MAKKSAEEEDKKYVYLVQELLPSNTPTKYYTVAESENRRRGVRQLQAGNPRHLLVIHSTVSQVEPGTVQKIHLHEQFIELCVFSIHHGGKCWYYCRSEREMKSKFRIALKGISTEDCRIE